MFKIIWKFKIKSENRAPFEEHYGSKGEWAQLFSKTHGYLGTELLRDFNEDLSFITIDSWRSEEDFEKFKSQYKTEYEALDKKCELLTVSEAHIGSFAIV